MNNHSGIVPSAKIVDVAVIVTLETAKTFHNKDTKGIFKDLVLVLKHCFFEKGSFYLFG